jgi:hypothetical protein
VAVAPSKLPSLTLDPLTVAGDATFLDRVAAERVLPAEIASGLRGPILTFGAATREGQRARRRSSEHGGRGVLVLVGTLAVVIPLVAIGVNVVGGLVGGAPAESAA